MKILATNGGAHPADKLAIASAEQILDAVFGKGASRSSSAALKLEGALVEVLEAAHAKVQRDERAAIVEHGLDRLAHPHDPAAYVTDAVAGLAAAAAKFGKIEIPDRDVAGATKMVDVAAHFARADVQGELASLIGRFMVTSIADERSWAIGDIPAAEAHRARHLPGFKHDPADPRVHAYRHARANGGIVTGELPPSTSAA